MTAWIGKNHNTPTWETSAAGPFDRWANGLGLDYFYGFNGGDGDDREGHHRAEAGARRRAREGGLTSRRRG
jgi:arylsulfatase A-like enzyme